MASMTLLSSAHAWGSSSYNSTTDIKVGKTGSSSSDGTRYRGRIRFDPLDKSIVITSIQLRMRRIDDYNAKTLTIGTSSSNAWGAMRDWTMNISISSGKNDKTWNLTPYKDIIQSYPGSFFFHIVHGSGSNTYCEFEGDGSNRPRLIIEYQYATVDYWNGSAWTKCLVYYNNGGTWIQCVPWYCSGGTWIQV